MESYRSSPLLELKSERSSALSVIAQLFINESGEFQIGECPRTVVRVANKRKGYMWHARKPSIE